MGDTFLTITEAVQYTGKSRRTLHRLAHQLAKTAPNQVMREKTDKGEIWRIHQQALQPAISPHQSAIQERNQSTAPLPTLTSTPFEEKYWAITQQGYGNLMAMHQEVKVCYKTLLHEKDRCIQELTQALAQSRRSFWQRVFGG